MHPDFSIVVTGHSLGGAMAPLAAITLKQNFSEHHTRVYSYGAPRTGVRLMHVVDTHLLICLAQNKVFADFVNDHLGANAFRGGSLFYLD